MTPKQQLRHIAARLADDKATQKHLNGSTGLVAVVVVLWLVGFLPAWAVIAVAAVGLTTALSVAGIYAMGPPSME